MELVSLTEYLIKQLLPDLENIEINNIKSDDYTIIQVLIPSYKMSAVIGKGGKIANSIRTIVQALAYTKKLGKVRINIDSI